MGRMLAGLRRVVSHLCDRPGAFCVFLFSGIPAAVWFFGLSSAKVTRETGLAFAVVLGLEPSAGRMAEPVGLGAVAFILSARVVVGQRQDGED